MAKTGFSILMVGAMLLGALVLPGCGKKLAKLPENRAEVAVDTALGCWARGEPPDKLVAAKQPIQASDPDWTAGCRLRSFLTIDAKPSADKPDHVRCRVALNMQDAKGQKVEKEVTYDVELGPTTVITRVPS